MKLFRIGCAVAATLAVVTMAKADEAAEKLIDEALPQMYHTCASLTKLADGTTMSCSMCWARSPP